MLHAKARGWLYCIAPTSSLPVRGEDIHVVLRRWVILPSGLTTVGERAVCQRHVTRCVHVVQIIFITLWPRPRCVVFKPSVYHNRSLISVTVNSSSTVRKRGTGKWLLGSFWRDVRMKCIPGHNPPLAFTHFPGIGPEPLNQLDSILPRSLS